jgi:hypothetical protein
MELLKLRDTAIHEDQQETTSAWQRVRRNIGTSCLAWIQSAASFTAANLLAR